MLARVDLPPWLFWPIAALAAVVVWISLKRTLEKLGILKSRAYLYGKQWRGGQGSKADSRNDEKKR